MKFSIIIPTYNRCATLLKTLASIELQTFPKNGFEVVIIDDGSTDDTKITIENFIKRKSLNVKYFPQLHLGHSRAKNFGIDNSQGDILLFCGDDIIFSRDLIENHYKIHRQTDNIVVLGLVLWDESIGVSDFMRYIAPNGPQFHFNTIKNEKDAGWDHFYTCNISVFRKSIGDLRFDPKYVFGFEDIDFGLTLAKKGLKILFNKEAIAYHSHFHTPESFYNRMITVGKSFVYFYSKYKKNKFDCLRLKWHYAPFDFLPGQLQLFNFLSKILSESKLLKKISLRSHWYFNICYYYSLGIIQFKNKNYA